MNRKKLPIEISDFAKDKIKEIRENKDIGKEYFLRLGVRSAGCGVASYVIGFDQLSDGDEMFEEDQIRIIIEKKQLMYLAAKRVDYGDFDGETGFVFLEADEKARS